MAYGAVESYKAFEDDVVSANVDATADGGEEAGDRFFGDGLTNKDRDILDYMDKADDELDDGVGALKFQSSCVASSL
jgi:hypothetical protein